MKKNLLNSDDVYRSTAMRRSQTIARVSVIFIVLILIFLVQNQKEIFKPTDYSSFVLRFVVFFAVSSMALVGWSRKPRFVSASLLVIAAVFELSQVFLVQRNFLLSDLIGNLLGVVLGIIFFAVARKFYRSMVR